MDKNKTIHLSIQFLELSFNFKNWFLSLFSEILQKFPPNTETLDVFGLVQDLLRHFGLPALFVIFIFLYST